MTPASPVMERSLSPGGLVGGSNQRTPISLPKALAGPVNCVSPEVSSQPMPWSPDAGAVNLLLSLPEIVSKEISKETIDWNDDSCGFPSVPRLDLSPSVKNCDSQRTSLSLSFRSIFSPRLAAIHVESEAHSPTKGDLECRTRTVSFDLCDDLASYHRSKTSAKSASGPTNATRRIPTRKAVLERQLQKHRQERSNRNKAPRSRGSSDSPPVVKTILRKKFSWKNYPELEAFLIANREEYLRHSALNYTTQQKQYNNRLTENLLDLAAKHGYVFDEACFNFVGVRDRIRCYYKSYVQSAKKRGIALGYAAKRAGLLSVTQAIP